jgi:hypothetical protein
MNSQDGNQTDSGIIINSYTTADPGNCYQIIEAGELEEQPGEGIENLELNKKNTEAIYDLQGRLVTGVPTHGVYIVNGKKVVVK